MPNDPAVMPMRDSPAPAGAGGTLREVVAKALEPIPFLGPLLAKAVLARAWLLLAVLVWMGWTFFLYPLLLPLVASAWINAGVLRQARPSYIEPVRQAFGAREFADTVAQESNRRLDYVQAVDFEGDASLGWNGLLSVVPNQKVIYRIEQASLTSEDKVRCPVPAQLGPSARLFTVMMEEVTVAEIRNGQMAPHRVTPDQWKAIAAQGGAPDHVSVTVQPVPALAELRCGKVKLHLRLLFEVYKDLVEVPA